MDKKDNNSEEEVCVTGHDKRGDDKSEDILILVLLSNHFIVDERDGQNKTHRRISERIWYLMVFCGIFGHYLKRYEKT